MSGASPAGEVPSGRLGAGNGAPQDGVGGRTGGRADPDGRLAQVVFALLVLGCFAAFVITQRLKHTPTAVQEFKLSNSSSPQSNGHDRLEAISFKLAKADEVTVTIVSSSGQDVATLVRERPVARYKKLSLRWNGREGAPYGYSVLTSAHGYKSLLPNNRGRLAPAGEYRVHVRLRAQGREFYSPRNFTLVRE